MPAGAPLRESVTGLEAVTLGVKDSAFPTEPEIAAALTTGAGTCEIATV